MRRAAALALLAASTVVWAAPPPAGRIERAPEFVQRVKGAVERGVAWLKKARIEGGAYPEFEGYPGATIALSYHALRVCGVPRDDVVARQAWSELKSAAPRRDPPTYTAALCLMALAAHGERDAGAADDRDVKLSAEDAKWGTELVKRLVEARSRDGGWSYGVSSQSHEEDHSNTQYALLGLKAAARCGLAVDPAVWTGELRHLCGVQEEQGPEVARKGPGFYVDRARAWDYHDSDVTKRAFGTTSMTAGCVGSLVICRSELLGTPEMTPRIAKRSEQAARDGLAWVGRRWSPFSTAADVDLYEAYAVERAGVLAGVEWMGDLDWYGRGADALTAAQLPDGSWNGVVVAGGGEETKEAVRARRIVGTCLALLFLARGTTPVHRGAVTQGADDLDVNLEAGAGLEGRALEEFLDVVLSKWRRASDLDDQRRLFDGATYAGPRIVEPLLARLDSADQDVRIDAHALLLRATGLEFGFDPYADAEARAASVVKWRAWWAESKDKLVYDPKAKRLVLR